MRQKELLRGFSVFIIRPRGRFMERKHNIGRIIGWAVMIVLTLILLPILVMNIILIAKGSSGSLVPPDIGGVAPLNVTSGSSSRRSKTATATFSSATSSITP